MRCQDTRDARTTQNRKRTTHFSCLVKLGFLVRVAITRRVHVPSRTADAIAAGQPASHHGSAWRQHICAMGGGALEFVMRYCGKLTFVCVWMVGIVMFTLDTPATWPITAYPLAGIDWQWLALALAQLLSQLTHYRASVAAATAAAKRAAANTAQAEATRSARAIAEAMHAARNGGHSDRALVPTPTHNPLPRDLDAPGLAATRWSLVAHGDASAPLRRRGGREEYASGTRESSAGSIALRVLVSAALIGWAALVARGSFLPMLQVVLRYEKKGGLAHGGARYATSSSLWGVLSGLNDQESSGWWLSNLRCEQRLAYAHGRGVCAASMARVRNRVVVSCQ